MKKSFFKKAFYSAVAAVGAFSLSASAYAAPKPEVGAVVSAEASANDTPLYKAGNDNILYQDDYFTLGVSPDETLETTALTEDGEPVLVSREEYVEGDYRYVDEIYCRQISSLSRSLEKYNWWGTHKVYYELNQDPGYSILLGTMKIEGTFTVDADQDIAVVDGDTVKCTTTKNGTDTYPIIYSDKPTCRSDVSDENGQPRYARVTYRSDFIKAAGVRDIHYMSFTVDSNNKAYVSCYHYGA